MSAQAARMRTDAETALIDAFDSNELKLRGASDLRAAAMARFEKTGLPHRRIESWHYTDLRAMMRQAAPIHTPDSATIAHARATLASPEAQTNALRLVVLDGAYRPDLSDLAELPQGVSVTSLAEALVAGDREVLAALVADGQGGDDAVVALNAALMQDGIVLRVAPGVAVDRLLAIVNLMSGGAAHAAVTRSLVLVGDGASVSLTETTTAVTPAATQSNEALIIRAGDNCRVAHVARVMRQGEGAVALNSLMVTLGAHCEFSSFVFAPDVALARRQIFARLTGEHTSVRFGGLSLLRGRQHCDTTLVLDHSVPNCTSRELFRHILEDASTGVFQGKIIVRQHAQKTDGAMKSQAIMLGDDAVMNNKPELEIFADDVVCGQLDDDQIFYLQARGLPRSEAEALLLEAFAAEALEQIADEPVRERFADQARAWLKQRGGR